MIEENGLVYLVCDEGVFLWDGGGNPHKRWDGVSKIAWQDMPESGPVLEAIKAKYGAIRDAQILWVQNAPARRLERERSEVSRMACKTALDSRGARALAGAEEGDVAGLRGPEGCVEF